MSNENLQCPQCNSTDVMFSKKRQVYVCEDCGHEFVLPDSPGEAEDDRAAVVEEVAPGPTRVFLSYAREDDEPFEIGRASCRERV